MTATDFGKSASSNLTQISKNKNPTKRKGHKIMTLQGYTYQLGDLFTTSVTGVTGRIVKFSPLSNKVTRVQLRLANGQQRFAMVKTSK
ncbi:hypothetical protein UFOVP1119_62 [uncultured Caudovirales phage]|uniref:Uncharacterized protein n=1 Tax=uncultured Caudovirales phage TaxID=2100421 RepID=A0A6J5RBM4_9CAUD|nr:hypothetical protein UFOVP1119_62 [uncultured Caudovirales phage]CAB4193212.1 hypothetical protein UFOVP1238_36 [uncultured Caudovirales phage]